MPFEVIKKLLIPAYVSFVCLFALSGNMVHIVQLVKGEAQEKKANVMFSLPFLEQVTKLDLLTGCVALGVVGAYWYFGKPWILNNVMGVSFCLLGIKLMAISSYKASHSLFFLRVTCLHNIDPKLVVCVLSTQAGAIMMLGLFVYDIFWVFGSKPVFGSNVMVTVAKNVVSISHPKIEQRGAQPSDGLVGNVSAMLSSDLLHLLFYSTFRPSTPQDAPILLKFPRGMNETSPGSPRLEFSMLGLGDIVVPGLFLACILRFDLMACEVPGGRLNSVPHFLCCVFAYVCALVGTVGAMLFFEAAQPALLYIVPLCLASTLVTTAAKGELGALLAFELPSTEESEAEGGEKETKKEK